MPCIRRQHRYASLNDPLVFKGFEPQATAIIFDHALQKILYPAGKRALINRFQIFRQFLPGCQCFLDFLLPERIPMSFVSDLARSEEQLSIRLLTVWQQHLERADQTIVEFSTGSARSRILRILRTLLVLQQEGADWDGTIQPLSVDDFSALAGISRESASRTLAALKREQVMKRVAPRRYRVDTKKLGSCMQALH